MMKIKLSYEHPEELQRVLHLLRPEIKSWKPAKKQDGQFKKAYIEINEPRAKHEE